MDLKSIDLKKIKALVGAERIRVIQEYKTERETLFQEYIKLQDILDEHNEKIHQVCCQIERLNIILKEMDVDLRK